MALRAMGPSGSAAPGVRSSAAATSDAAACWVHMQCCQHPRFYAGVASPWCNPKITLTSESNGPGDGGGSCTEEAAVAGGGWEAGLCAGEALSPSWCP